MEEKFAMDFDVKKLIEKAINSRNKAYTPYSKFKVGACLLTEDSNFYGGFNIECAAYSVSNCAERTAIFRAIYDGHTIFKAISVVGGDENQTNHFSDFCPPCGVCRQLLREFCNPKIFKVVLAKSTNEFNIFTLDELLPNSFGPNNLK